MIEVRMANGSDPDNGVVYWDADDDFFMYIRGEKKKVNINVDNPQLDVFTFLTNTCVQVLKLTWWETHKDIISEWVAQDPAMLIMHGATLPAIELATEENVTYFTVKFPNTHHTQEHYHV